MAVLAILTLLCQAIALVGHAAAAAPSRGPLVPIFVEAHRVDNEAEWQSISSCYWHRSTPGSLPNSTFESPIYR